jgi:lipopolysaccharide export system permease protein
MTWERYFYKQLLKSALTFLMVFYGLYVLVDYSSHLSGVHYHHSSLKIGEFFVQYACEFIIRAEILIPFALLIGTIYTLTKYNQRSELIALLANGLSLHRLMVPYLVAAILAILFLYLNTEFFLPMALHKQNTYDQKHAEKKISKEVRAQHFLLEDGSALIYRYFDRASQVLEEVYWVPSANEIWRIAQLNPFKQTPLGLFVDHFTRVNGHFTHQASYPSYAFAEMRLSRKKLHDSFLAPDQLPLSQLIAESPDSKTAEESEKAARALTALYRKLTLPWLSLLAVIGPAPFCLRFSRHQPLFLIFAGAIFSLVALYLFCDAACVLAERQVLTPLSAILIPMACFLTLSLYRFIRMRT